MSLIPKQAEMAKEFTMLASNAAIKGRIEAAKGKTMPETIKALVEYLIGMVNWQGMASIDAKQSHFAGMYPQGYIPTDSARMQCYKGIIRILIGKDMPINPKTGKAGYNLLFGKSIDQSKPALSATQAEKLFTGHQGFNLVQTWYVAQGFYSLSGIGRIAQKEGSEYSKIYSSEIRKQASGLLPHEHFTKAEKTLEVKPETVKEKKEKPKKEKKEKPVK